MFCPCQSKCNIIMNYWKQFVLDITVVSMHAKIALEIPYSQ